MATTLAAIVIAVAALVSIPGLLDTSRAFAARDAQRHQVTASLARFAEERGAVLVSWGGSLDTGFKPPLAAPDDALYDIDVISLGWPTHSPDWSAQLERVGIDDLGEALLHDPRLYIAARPTLFEPLAWYMYEHHGELPDFSLAFARAPGTLGHHSDLFRLYLRTDLPDDLPPSGVVALVCPGLTRGAGTGSGPGSETTSWRGRTAPVGSEGDRELREGPRRGRPLPPDRR